jgi:crotonobetainyl-CoA:carnitine CoA-transferase CaiB-like acyl-CoA transferase
MGGAERAVSATPALLLRRAACGHGARADIALRDAAEAFAAPLRDGLTTRAGALGGARPTYALYRARDAWIAVAAIEPHFEATLVRGLGKRFRACVRRRRFGDTRALRDRPRYSNRSRARGALSAYFGNTGL